MKTPSQIEKIKIVNKRNIDNFIKIHGIAYPEAKKVKKTWIVPKQGKRHGDTMFLTATFKDRIYSKPEAEKLFKSFLKDLRVYTPFSYCCVPEKHVSGAYHYHLLISLTDKTLSLNDFKERIRRLRCIGFIAVEWTWGPVENVVWYLVQYLTSENLNSIEGRCVSYSKDVPRVANSRIALWNSHPHRFGWREKWKNMCLFIPERTRGEISSENVREYYDRIVCRSGCSDRLILIDFSRASDMSSMFDYVECGIRENIIKSPQIHHSDFLHNQIVLQGILKDTDEFENEISGVPF